MTTNVDFDISSYTVDELINVIGLGNQRPLTNEKIVSTIQALQEQFEDKYEQDKYLITVNHILDVSNNTLFDEIMIPNTLEVYKKQLEDEFGKTPLINTIDDNSSDLTDKQNEIWEIYKNIGTANSIDEINARWVRSVIKEKLEKIGEQVWNDWVTSAKKEANDVLGNLIMVPKAGDGDSFKIEFKKKMQEDALFNYNLTKEWEEKFSNETKFNKNLGKNVDNPYFYVLMGAYYAKEAYLIFFNDIADKLRDYRKDEYSTNYYEEEEENQASLLEGNFMNEDEKILANGNAAQPIWNRTTFVRNQGENPTFPKDYKNPLSIPTISKTINIDSGFRTIPDPVVCPECPDTLETYLSEIGSGSNQVISSNNDGKHLIVGVSGEDLYRFNADLAEVNFGENVETWDDLNDYTRWSPDPNGYKLWTVTVDTDNYTIGKNEVVIQNDSNGNIAFTGWIMEEIPSISTSTIKIMSLKTSGNLITDNITIGSFLTVGITDDPAYLSINYGDKSWVDLTMNYGGNALAICNSSNIWFSRQGGNAWYSGKLSPSKIEITFTINEQDITYNSGINVNQNTATCNLKYQMSGNQTKIVLIANKDQETLFSTNHNITTSSNGSTTTIISAANITKMEIKDVTDNLEISGNWVSITSDFTGQYLYAARNTGDYGHEHLTKGGICFSSNYGETWVDLSGTRIVNPVNPTDTSVNIDMSQNWIDVEITSKSDKVFAIYHFTNNQNIPVIINKLTNITNIKIDDNITLNGKKIGKVIDKTDDVKIEIVLNENIDFNNNYKSIKIGNETFSFAYFENMNEYIKYYMIMSTDYGVTWSTINYNTFYVGASITDLKTKNWKQIVSNYYGDKIYAISNSELWRTYNYGVNWAQVEFSDVTNMESLTCSLDGTKLAVWTSTKQIIQRIVFIYSAGDGNVPDNFNKRYSVGNKITQKYIDGKECKGTIDKIHTDDSDTFYIDVIIDEDSERKYFIMGGIHEKYKHDYDSDDVTKYVDGLWPEEGTVTHSVTQNIHTDTTLNDDTIGYGKDIVDGKIGWPYAPYYKNGTTIYDASAFDKIKWQEDNNSIKITDNINVTYTESIETKYNIKILDNNSQERTYYYHPIRGYKTGGGSTLNVPPFDQQATISVSDVLNPIITYSYKLKFSEDGGENWKDYHSGHTYYEADNAKILLSDDGNRIIGLDKSGKIFSSKKCIKRNNEMFDRPSNFTLNLSEPIKNVINMSYTNLELPHAWNVFNHDEGTEHFYYKNATGGFKTVTIEEGSYDITTLLETLNNGDFDISFNSTNGNIEKINEENQGSTNPKITIEGPSSGEIKINVINNITNNKYHETDITYNINNTRTDLTENLKKEDIYDFKYNINQTDNNGNATIEIAVEIKPKLVFQYISYQNKIKITNNTGSAINIYWFRSDIASDHCSPYGNGPKANYNLGWLLGFRKSFYYIPNGESIKGEGNLDLKGTKYIYIALDEFSNNKTTDTQVTFENNVGSFKMPSYFVKPTMEKEISNMIIGTGDKEGLVSISKDRKGNLCWIKKESLPKPGPCGSKRNPNLLSSLTSKQRYTIANIRNTLILPKTNQYKSPHISNLLQKIPLQFFPNLSPALQYTSHRIDLKEYIKRKYFGPVTLRKFRIKLLNDKGNEIRMNEDWSFSILVDQLYNNK